MWEITMKWTGLSLLLLIAAMASPTESAQTPIPKIEQPKRIILDIIPCDAGNLKANCARATAYCAGAGGARNPTLASEHSADAKQQMAPAMYREWEVDVPTGTKLDSLRERLNAQAHLLPEKDLEDTTALPIWFRVYLRKNNPGLATSGPYQYPRTANRMLQRLLGNPDSDKLD